MSEREHVAIIRPWETDPDAVAAALEREKANAKRTIVDGYNLRRPPADVSDVDVVSIDERVVDGELEATITFRLIDPD